MIIISNHPSDLITKSRMMQQNRLCFSHFYVLFVILLVPILAVDYYMPQFTQLPPPVVYINRDDTQHKLTCRAWPHTTKTEVKMYYVTRADSTLGMYPIHSNWPTSADQPGEITLHVSGSRMLDDLQTKRLHCIAKNEFGGLLSRPFEVVEAYMADFPPLSIANDHSNIMEGAKMVLSFLKGNVAVLDCPAPYSQPPAILTFSKNSESIQVQRSKNSPKKGHYRYVTWPSGNGVSLLISSVQEDDMGMYQCEAMNPHTFKKIKSPWQYRLDVKPPSNRIPAQVRRPLFGSALQRNWVPSANANLGNGLVNNPDQVIRVREGQNASLFCVMEASPVPSVDIYPEAKSDPGSRGYLRMHLPNPPTKVTDNFGVYQINNLQPSDAGNYVCTTSDSPVASSPAQVQLIRRLNITNPLYNMALNGLGENVRLSCFVDKSNASGGNVITPNHRVQWYRNGLLITSYGAQEGFLTVEGVQRDHLGIYQCVAISADEWVSRYALVYLKDDKVLTKAIVDQEKERPPDVKVPPAPKKDSDDARGNRLGRNEKPGENVKVTKPKAITFFANLAVMLSWALERVIPDSNSDTSWSFRVQMQRARHHTKEGEQEIVSQWTEPVDVLEKLQMTNVLVRKGLSAGQIYRFCVIRESPNSNSLIQSPWSDSVSFTHVGVTAPLITNHTISQGKIQLHWIYLDQKEFPISHFSILSRKMNKQLKKGYINTTIPVNLDVNNAQSAEIQLQFDEPYEIVVLGQSWDPVRNRSRFTIMSSAINVTVPKPIRPTPPRSGQESHMYMIYIVTSAGAATTLVILILLVLCACHTCMEKKQARQRREDWLMNSSAVTNSGPGACSTMPPIYKDPAKLLHRENSLLLRYAPSPNGGDRVGDIHGDQGNLHSAAAASLLNYPQEANGTLSRGGGNAAGINSSSFMLASLTSQSQQQNNQSHYQAGHYGSRFQSLQRGGSIGYQATPSMAMMKREPPSGGDSVNDNMDGAGYQSQQQQNQQGGTLYHRGGPMSNSLAGSRLLLPHANSPPLTTTPMMAQAMSLQALHIASNQPQANHRDSMHIPQTNYMSSTTARGSTATPLSPLTPLSPPGGGGNAPLSPQQQQLLAWQQQQAMAAAMMNYTNQGGQTPSNGYNGTSVSPMDMYYAAAAAHALRMQHAAAFQQQAATLRQQHHQGDGNESVYSYFSQPTHQLHHTLDGSSPATNNATGFFQHHMTMSPGGMAMQQMQQGARPGSVQPPPTLQEQEEEQSIGNNHAQANGEMASNGTGSISGRPPSSTGGNHHHHHRRRRRKQAASGAAAQQSHQSQQTPPNQSQGNKHLTSDENGEMMDDDMAGAAGAMDTDEMNNTPEPHMPPPPPSSGLDNNAGDGRPMAQVQPMAPSNNYHAKYVNHGSFPPPVAQYPMGGHHPNTSLYQSHYHHPHPHPLYQNSLNRRGTPTLLVEPPRMRDYSEYGIPPNQVAATSAAPSDVEDLGGAGGDMGAVNRLSSTYLPPPPPRV